MPYPIDASTLYTLQGPRQKSWKYICEIWGVPNDGSWDGSQGDPSAKNIKLYFNVPLGKHATPEFDMPGTIGQGELVNFETLDSWTCHAEQPLQNGWYIRCVTTPDGTSASNQLWWMVVGNAQAYDRRAQTSRYKAKRTKTPKWAS